MARGMSREIHSQDYVADLAGVVDYTNLRLGMGSIAEVDKREFDNTIDYEAFMAEPLVIAIADTQDKNAPPAVAVSVNGEHVWLPRRAKVRIPRRFVEVLARSQATTLKTRQTRDPNADDAMETLYNTAQDYGFSVLHDPNPKGRAWLERVTREGC